MDVNLPRRIPVVTFQHGTADGDAESPGYARLRPTKACSCGEKQMCAVSAWRREVKSSVRTMSADVTTRALDSSVKSSVNKGAIQIQL